MRIQSVYRFFALLLLIALDVSCTARVVAAGAAPAAERTRQPKQPQVFPTSSYRPSTTPFNIILGRPTADSVTVSLYAQTNLSVSIAYGTLPGQYTTRTAPVDLKAGAPQNIELSGLAANTTYYYQATANGTPGAEHTFHTRRPAGSAFTFTLDADPHNRDPRFNGELYATVMNNAAGDRPDFHIDLGDTFMTEKVKPQGRADVESTFADMRPYFGLLAADAPLFLVNGNHEGELGWLLENSKDKDLALWAVQLRQQYYPNPQPGGFYTGSTTPDAHLGNVRDGYYAWTWGDALFIVLDPFWYTTRKPAPGSTADNWNWTLGKEQYDWLKATLAGSTAQFKFIFTHHLVGGSAEGRGGVEAAGFFEWGGRNSDGSPGFDQHRPGWGKPIHQLLVENHVSAVFHGHDHVFVKQDLDGIVYQEVPQPSNAEYNNTRIAAEYGYLNGDIFGSSGHLRVMVAPGRVTLEYVRAYLKAGENNRQHNGQSDYSYTITAPAPQ